MFYLTVIKEKRKRWTWNFFSYHFIVPSFEHSNKCHWSRGIQFTSQVKESSAKITQKKNTVKLKVNSITVALTIVKQFFYPQMWCYIDHTTENLTKLPRPVIAVSRANARYEIQWLMLNFSNPKHVSRLCWLNCMKEHQDNITSLMIFSLLACLIIYWYFNEKLDFDNSWELTKKPCQLQNQDDRSSFHGLRDSKLNLSRVFIASLCVWLIRFFWLAIAWTLEFRLALPGLMGLHMYSQMRASFLGASKVASQNKLGICILWLCLVRSLTSERQCEIIQTHY